MLRTMDLRYRRQGYELNVLLLTTGPIKHNRSFPPIARAALWLLAMWNKRVEIVNVRVRMEAAGEAYLPMQQELVPGDGSRSLLCDPGRLYFDGSFVPDAALSARRPHARRRYCGAGNDY